MSAVEVLTKYGHVRLKADAIGVPRILVITQDAEIPKGNPTPHNGPTKEPVQLAAGTVLHKTWRHSGKDEDPQYDIVPHGIWDLRSRLERVGQFERETDTQVIYFHREAVRRAQFMLTRYRELSIEERQQLVRIDLAASKGIRNAVNEHKVAVREHLLNGENVYDKHEPPRPNPGKTRAALVAAERRLLMRSDEIQHIFKHISVEALVCESEIVRIVDQEYTPIGEMAAYWLHSGEYAKHLESIQSGLTFACAKLKSVTCAPYRFSAQQLIQMLEASGRDWNEARLEKVLQLITQRVHGERFRTSLLAANVELGYLEAAQFLHPGDYGMRMRKLSTEVNSRAHRVLRYTGSQKQEAVQHRENIFRLMREAVLHQPQRKVLKRVREHIKQLAMLVNTDTV